MSGSRVSAVDVRLAFVAVSLAAAACSGSDPQPSPVPTGSPPTTSPPQTTAPSSPTATPTLAAPTLPAAARADTPAGAESFVRFWLTALDHAYKTGDTKPFRALGTCKSCEALGGSIERFYAAGGRFIGGKFTVDSARTTRHVKSSAALVDLKYSRSAGRAVPGSGLAKDVSAVKGVEFLLFLERSRESWRVISVKTVERR
jgi:Family of unknown function (DUF6318)